MRQYSPYFNTLHDELGPTGHLGRGTHYSVLRTLSWYDLTRSRLDEAVHFDFAVIWDEDHDTRVISVIERLHVKGLLVPLLFVGERKGTITLVSEAEMPKSFRNACSEVVQAATEDAGDAWDSSSTCLHASPLKIIDASDDDVRLYLNAIKMVWRLGCKLIAS